MQILLTIISLLEYHISALVKLELITLTAIDKLFPDILGVLAKVFQLIQVFVDNVKLDFSLPLTNAFKYGIIAVYVLPYG